MLSSTMSGNPAILATFSKVKPCPAWQFMPFSFAKKTNPKIVKSKATKKLKLPLNQTMNLSRLNKITKKKYNW